MIYEIPLEQRPEKIKDGEVYYEIDRKLVETNDEIALGLQFICNRELFGHCYRTLMPDIYDRLGRDGGVMIAPFVPSSLILPSMEFPGDIDLLIIPYRDNRLIISDTLVLELKIVRASFEKQGKSPNEYGISQAKSFLKYGFPYSAVAHLIISDESPRESWRLITTARIIDDQDHVEMLGEREADMLPYDLLNRSFGRLMANCDEPLLGLIALYYSDKQNGLWFPNGQMAQKNSAVSSKALEAITNFYQKYFEGFLDTPKY